LEPDRIVFYWTGRLPEISELSILSALNKSKNSKIQIFMDTDVGFESTVSVRLEELKKYSRISFIPFSLSEWAKEVQPTAIPRATSVLRRYVAFALNVLGFPGPKARLKLAQRFINLIGYWHPIHGWRAKTDPLYSLTFAGPEFRGDVFRLLLSGKYPGESLLYLDLDVYVSQEFRNWPLEKSFSYWGGETWANTAVLYYQRDRLHTSEYLIERYRAGEWAVPWFMFSDRNCHGAGIHILSTSLFDPGWTETCISYGESGLFFQAGNSAKRFIEEIDSDFLAVHWHNQWGVVPEVGSPYIELLARERRQAKSDIGKS